MFCFGFFNKKNSLLPPALSEWLPFAVSTFCFRNQISPSVQTSELGNGNFFTPHVPNTSVLRSGSCLWKSFSVRNNPLFCLVACYPAWIFHPCFIVLYGVPAYDTISELSTQRKITLIMLDQMFLQNPHELSQDVFPLFICCWSSGKEMQRCCTSHTWWEMLAAAADHYNAVVDVCFTVERDLVI